LQQAGSPSPSLRRAVFLDRDGVLNEDRDDYVKSAEEMRLIPGAGRALARLRDAGYLCVLITNQSPVGRGIFTHEWLAGIHECLIERLLAEGGDLDDIEYCPHRPDEQCDCRKPRPGMLLRAIAKHGVAPARSFMVGDKESDVAAGKAAGVRTIRVLIPDEDDATHSEADWKVRSLREAADVILSLEEGPA